MSLKCYLSAKTYCCHLIWMFNNQGNNLTLCKPSLNAEMETHNAPTMEMERHFHETAQPTGHVIFLTGCRWSHSGSCCGRM